MRALVHVLLAACAAGLSGCGPGGGADHAAATSATPVTSSAPGARARVVDAAGAPVAGALVIVESVATGEADEPSTTASDGTLDLPLAPGRWALTAVGAGGASERLEVDVVAGATLDVALTVREEQLDALVEDFVRQGPTAVGLEEGE